MNPMRTPETDSQILGSDVRALKRGAEADPRRRARICLHWGDGDERQEMLIAVCRDSYVRPHRQIGYSKTYLVIDGAMQVGFFTEAGGLERVEQMGLGDDNVRALRFQAGLWHSVMPVTSVAVYLETIAGPYSAENTDWAGWAPHTAEEGLAFLRRFTAAKRPG